MNPVQCCAIPFWNCIHVDFYATFPLLPSNQSRKQYKLVWMIGMEKKDSERRVARERASSPSVLMQKKPWRKRKQAEGGHENSSSRPRVITLLWRLVRRSFFVIKKKDKKATNFHFILFGEAFLFFYSYHIELLLPSFACMLLTYLYCPLVFWSIVVSYRMSDASYPISIQQQAKVMYWIG